jgi:hypothetical protein
VISYVSGDQVLLKASHFPSITFDEQSSTVRKVFDMLVGTHIGGGIFELPVEKFSSDHPYTPEGFVALERIAPEAAGKGVSTVHFIEVWQFWRIKGSNFITSSDIDGLGYTRIDYQAIVDENG